MGRPKENTDTMPEGWEKEILELYSDGASDVEVKALIWKWRGSFSSDLWTRWMAEDVNFSETIKMGRQISEAWWQRSGRKNLKEKDFNYTGWYMNMKNRFGWADKKEVKQDVDLNAKGSVSISQWIDDASTNE